MSVLKSIFSVNSSEKLYHVNGLRECQKFIIDIN